MITAYLLVSHLISDFILQPASLVRWKMTSYRGTLFHVFIFILVSLAVLFPFIYNYEIWIVIFLIGIVHFFTDQAKINIELKNDPSDIPFIADQGIHYLSLVIGGYFLDSFRLVKTEGWFGAEHYNNMYFWIILLCVIYAGYLLKIALIHKTREKVLHKIIIFTFIYLIYTGTFIVVF
ncbi:DUF3307 domain-containing protein [Candidatus Peregrinibacteria bacterium]|nr:DUF3307 domain-containing protein [Candidatus Peregrinibacteria bacterium]